MKTCNKCRKSKDDECFIGRGGCQCVVCDHCRGIIIKSHNKHKCEHKHQRTKCKLCSDPIHITVIRMITGSRQSDRLYDRFFDLNYEPTKNKLIETTHCPYPECRVSLQYMERAPNMATIERLDNTKGHTDDNTIICCLSCNTTKVGNTIITAV